MKGITMMSLADSVTSLERQRTAPLAQLKVGRRTLRATAAFFTYWRFAAERQAMFFRRLKGLSTLTADPILASHRFTNVYRASDRVSQYLISDVISGSNDETDVVFRTLLFKLFNRIDTWEYLLKRFGAIHFAEYSARSYDRALTEAITSGERIYSPAYIMPSPSLGRKRKHSNHLRLLESIMRNGIAQRLSDARSLKQAYETLLAVPSIGPFLAFQFAIDLNYGPVLNFSEMDFVVAGPGAISGIRKCFADTDDLSNEDIIRVMTDLAPKLLERSGLKFMSLWGRPLQLIDCQNLFCEVDKYSRVAHPELVANTQRTRIKQRYRRNSRPISATYPPKWKLDTSCVPEPPPLSGTAA